MADKIRVAIVGVGVMGSKYADMIVSGEVKNTFRIRQIRCETAFISHSRG